MAKQQNVTKPWDQDLMDQIQQRKTRELNEKRGYWHGNSLADHRSLRRQALLQLEEQKRRASETPEETRFRLGAAYAGTQNAPTHHEAHLQEIALRAANLDLDDILGKDTIKKHRRKWGDASFF